MEIENEEQHEELKENLNVLVVLSSMPSHSEY